jgi:hypothetical protein
MIIDTVLRALAAYGVAPREDLFPRYMQRYMQGI